MTRIYVRMSNAGYEGQEIRFATLDEGSAVNRFTPIGQAFKDTGEEIYAPDYSGEELQIWEDGKYVETYTRSTDGKWFKDYYSKSRTEYGVIQL